MNQAAGRLDPLFDFSRVPGADLSATPEQRLSSLCRLVRERFHSRHLCGPADLRVGAEIVRRQHPDFAAKMIADADGIVDGHFVQPELEDRLYSLRPLNYAWALTRHEKYIRRGIQLIQAWAMEKAGPANEMDRAAHMGSISGARRLQGLLQFLSSTRDCAAWTDEHVASVLVVLWEHADYLSRHQHLHWHNIYFVTLVARHQLMLYLPEFRVAAEWEPHTLSEVLKCAAAQVRVDGSQLEQSPGYHRTTMEAFTTVALSRMVCGLPVPEELTQVVDRMARYLASLLMPTGALPPLSDTGRGQNGGDALFFTSMIRQGPRYFRAHPSAEQHLTLPAERIAAELARPDAPPPERHFAARDAGYFVMRSGWDEKSTYLICDAGPLGYYHGHLDLFSIDLCIGRRELLPEPGIYNYVVNPERQGFRGTVCHNTISLDNLDHRPYEDTDESLVTVHQWETPADGSAMLSASHRAYDHLWGKPAVSRQIYFDGQGLFVIVDWLDCSIEKASRRVHSFQASFTLPDAQQAEIQRHEGWAKTTYSDGPNLFLRALNRSELDFFDSAPTTWNDGGQMRQTVRLTAIKNTDRGWMAHVIRVGEGPAAEATGTASSDQSGTVHVVVKCRGRTYAIDFERLRITCCSVEPATQPRTTTTGRPQRVTS